jgi:hypothetical protein
MHTKLDQMVFADVKRPSMHECASAVQWSKLWEVCVVLQLEGTLGEELSQGHYAREPFKTKPEAECKKKEMG